MTHKVVRNAHRFARVVSRRVIAAQEQAKQILSDARDEAQALLEQSKRESALIRKQAEATGRATAKEEAAAMLAQAAKVREQQISNATEEIIDIAIACADRIIGEDLNRDPERVRAICTAAQKRVLRAKRVQVRVHPEDAVLLHVEASWGEIIPDNSITRGGCVVTSELGTIDARIETQLDALREWLKTS